MLNSVTVKEWRPVMNRHMRIQSLSAGTVFSSFDLEKGFLQVSIPREDQTYFGMFLWGLFYVFTRFPFGVLNSMRFFNTVLASTVNTIAKRWERGDILKRTNGCLGMSMIR